MATKPTQRILDWASGGTNTDPGASKEAAGWLTSERPPAYWWNWILNSFGKWHTWAETSIDAIETKTDFISVTQAVDLDVIETDVAANKAAVAFAPVAVVRLVTGSSSTVRHSIGPSPTLTFAVGGDIGEITFGSALGTTANEITVSAMAEKTGLPNINIVAQVASTTKIEFSVMTADTGTVLDLDETANAIECHFVVWSD